MSQLAGRLLDIRPDVAALGRAVSGLPGSAVLWSSDPRQPSYVMADPIAQTEQLDPEPALPLGAGSQLHRAPRWVGLLPYESRRTLERAAWSSPEARSEPHLTHPLWLRYGACAVVRDRVLVVGDEPAAVSDLCRVLRRASSVRPIEIRAIGWRDSAEAHAERVRAALERIVAGDIYQVNLARRLDLSVVGRPVDVLTALRRIARVPYCAAVRAGELGVISTSPELFLRQDVSGVAWTHPIKGTRPRGGDAGEDAQLRIELDEDPKESAELSMVVDVERNDLGRGALPGTVQVMGRPRVETYGTVHHRVARIRARLRPDVTRLELLRNMLPSGSVTGAPKIRAMEVIAELENERRGLYTGALGLMRHDGSLELSMAIRTLTVRDGVGHYFSGGGIVADSEPHAEAMETAWKAAQVTRLLTSLA